MLSEFDDANVTLICCRTHVRASRPEAGEFSALYEVEDPETGEKGHWAYIYEWDKRDVMLEQVTTDNPALAVDPDADSPCSYSWAQIQDDTGVEPIKHPAWPGCSIHVWGDES